MNPRRVIQELPECDVTPLRVLGQQRAQGIREMQPTRLHEPHDRRRGELLRERPEAIDRLAVGGEMMRAILLASAAKQQGVAMVDDGERSASRWRIAHEVVSERVEPCDDVGPDGVLCGRREARGGDRENEQDRCDAHDSGAPEEWCGWRRRTYSGCRSKEVGVRRASPER